MEKLFVPYNLALKMKVLGFNKPCFGAYEPDATFCEVRSAYSIDFANNIEGRILAPTFSQAFRWFREKHKVITEITFYNNGETWEDTEFKATVTRFEDFATHNTFVKNDIKSYEDAELYCLEKLIEIVENKSEKDGSSESE